MDSGLVVAAGCRTSGRRLDRVCYLGRWCCGLGRGRKLGWLCELIRRGRLVMDGIVHSMIAATCGLVEALPILCLPPC